LRTTGGIVPSPWLTGAVAFVLGMAVMFAPPTLGWAAVAAMLTIDAVFLALVTLFSQKASWNALHPLSLAAGGALAYGIHAFTGRPLVGGVLGMRISNTVFLAAAVLLIFVCARRVIRYQTN